MDRLLKLDFNCRKETYSVALGKIMACAGREINSLLGARKPLWISLLFMKHGIVGFEEIFLQNSNPVIQESFFL